MNKNNILNRSYMTNERILKHASVNSFNNTNLYSSFFYTQKKESQGINFRREQQEKIFNTM